MTHRAPVSTEEKLFRCWADGFGIAQTIAAVRRTCGTTLTFEQVRTTFAEITHRFTATNQEAAHG